MIRMQNVLSCVAVCIRNEGSDPVFFISGELLFFLLLPSFFREPREVVSVERSHSFDGAETKMRQFALQIPSSWVHTRL